MDTPEGRGPSSSSSSASFLTVVAAYSSASGSQQTVPHAASSPSWSRAMGEWSWEAAFHGSVHTATLAVATVLALFVLVLGSFGNGLVLCSALRRRRRVRSNFDLLILNLAGADLILCVLLAPLYLYTLFADPPAPKAFCGSLLFSGTGCGLLSLLTIVAIAVHRQARVSGRAKRALTTRQTFIALGAVWVVSGAGAIGATLHAMMDWRDQYTNCQVLLYSPRTTISSSTNTQTDGASSSSSSPSSSSSSSSPLVLHRFTLFFLGPVVVVSFVVIIVAYVVIARAVRAQSRARLQGLAALYRSTAVPIYRPPDAKPQDTKFTELSSKPAGGFSAIPNSDLSTKPTSELKTHTKDSSSSKPTDPLVPKSAQGGFCLSSMPMSINPPPMTSPATSPPVSSSLRKCHCCSCQAAAERDSKAVAMCLVVILTLVLCWSPLLVSQFLELATGPSIILLQVKLCGIALVFLNSALDPYMYAQNQTSPHPQGANSASRAGHYARFVALFWELLRCQCGNPRRTSGKFRPLGGARPAGPQRFSLLEADTPSLPLPPPREGGKGEGHEGLLPGERLSPCGGLLPCEGLSPCEGFSPCEELSPGDDLVDYRPQDELQRCEEGVGHRKCEACCCCCGALAEGEGRGGLEVRRCYLLPSDEPASPSKEKLLPSSETFLTATNNITPKTLVSSQKVNTALVGQCSKGVSTRESYKNVGTGQGHACRPTSKSQRKKPLTCNKQTSTGHVTKSRSSYKRVSHSKRPHHHHATRTKDVIRDVRTLVHKSCCHTHAPSDQSLVES